MKHQTQRYGPLIAATAIIWAFATGMFAICIPLVNMTQSGVILPLAVILGVSASTVVIWGTNHTRNSNFSELKNNVFELQQRNSGFRNDL